MTHDEYPSSEESDVTTTGDAALDALIRSAVSRELRELIGKLTHLEHHIEHQLSGTSCSLAWQRGVRGCAGVGCVVGSS